MILKQLIIILSVFHLQLFAASNVLNDNHVMDIVDNYNQNRTRIIRSSSQNYCYCVAKHICINGVIASHFSNFALLSQIPCRNGRICCQKDTPIIFPTESPPKTTTLAPRTEIDTTLETGCGHSTLKVIKFVHRMSSSEHLHHPLTSEIFPWLIKLHKFKNGIPVMNGGGMLIHPSVVLTTAFHLKGINPDQITVTAGIVEDAVAPNSYSAQVVNVKEIVRHERFQFDIYNDIALLFLEEPLTLGEFIRPICLPPPTLDIDNKIGLFTGWGKESYNDSNYSEYLKNVIEIPIHSRAVCEQIFRRKVMRRFRLHESSICAGGSSGEDACIGDGGMPLMYKVPKTQNKYYAVGMVSWGIGCESGVPGVYTNLKHFLNWIKLQFENNGYNWSTPF